MKTPTDCQLLSLGMNFVRLMYENKSSEVMQLLEPDSCEEAVKDLLSNESYRSMMANLCTIHALVKDEQNPRIFLLFNVGETDLFSHILSCKADDAGDTFLIQGVLSKGDFGESTHEPIRLPSNGLSGFDMMDVVVPFTIADAICDTEYAKTRLADDVVAFGIKGKERVIEFKDAELADQILLDLPAYKLEDPFKLNLEKEVVELGFECVMPTKPGAGMDYVTLNSEKLVSKIESVRF